MSQHGYQGNRLDIDVIFNAVTVIPRSEHILPLIPDTMRQSLRNYNSVSSTFRAQQAALYFCLNDCTSCSY